MPVTNHPEETFQSLYKTDEQLKSVDVKKYTTLVSDEKLKKTVAALESKKYNVHVVDKKDHVLDVLKKIVKDGSSVYNVHSTSLEEVGFVEYLKTQTNWVNLHAKVFETQDPAEQARRTKAGHQADYVFTSVTAISEEGDLTAADLTGTKTGVFAFQAGHLVVVASTNKIVPTYQDCVERTEKFCLPVESARVRIAYKIPGSQINNFVALRGPNPMSPVNRVTVVLVKEQIGY